MWVPYMPIAVLAAHSNVGYIVDVIYVLFRGPVSGRVR